MNTPSRKFRPNCIGARPARLAGAFAALALTLLAAPAARAGSVPQKCLDECTGGEGAIHVQGWAYDPDASSQSIDIHAYLYTDSDCANQ